MTQIFSSYYRQCHPQEGLAKLIDVTEGAVNLWKRTGVMPGANDQWILLT